MAGGFSGLAGLSGVYPGMLQTAQAEDVVDAYQQQKTGQELFGNTLKMLAGQGQPQQPQMQPLQPYGGAPQPSQGQGPPPGGFRPPMMQPYQQGPQGAPNPMQQQPPGPPPGAPAGGPPVRPPPAGGAAAPTPAPGGGPMAAIQQAAQTGQLDIRTAATLIARANPNAKPRDIVAALNVAMPYLKAEEQMQVAQLRLDMQRERLAESTRLSEERIGLQQERVGLEQQKVEQAGKRVEQGAERLHQSQERIDNLQAHRQFEQDLQLKQFAQKQIEAERRFAQTGRKEDQAEAKRMYDAGIARARIALQSKSFMVDAPPEEKARITGDVDKLYKSYTDKIEMQRNQGAPASTGTPRTNSQTEWFKTQSKNWSPEQRAKVLQDLKDAGYDTSGLE